MRKPRDNAQQNGRAVHNRAFPTHPEAGPKMVGLRSRENYGAAGPNPAGANIRDLPFAHPQRGSAKGALASSERSEVSARYRFLQIQGFRRTEALPAAAPLSDGWPPAALCLRSGELSLSLAEPTVNLQRPRRPARPRTPVCLYASNLALWTRFTSHKNRFRTAGFVSSLSPGQIGPPGCCLFK